MRVNVITAVLSLKNLSLTLVLTLSGASFNLAFGATRYVWDGSPSVSLRAKSPTICGFKITHPLRRKSLL